MIINESEARIVKRMYSEYAEGKSLFGISRSLNKDRIPARSKHSQGWWQTSVRQVLLNPVYKGTEVVNRHSHISLIKKMDLSNAIMISVPALVSEQIWQIAQDRMQNNKHVKPNKQKTSLLQGMITCGTCGYVFASKQKYYTCRGRMKEAHPDGKLRCNTRNLRKEWLDNEVWKRIEGLINDPDKLYPLIKESIENLRVTETELSARIKPIDERLTEIAEQKARLAEDWVMKNLNWKKFEEIKNNLDKEESRIMSLRADIDPNQIEELETTRSMLDFWERQIKSMIWNTENEDGSMFRLVDKPHHFALNFIGFDDDILSKAAGFPTSKRQLLDKLQVRLIVFDDRVEVKSVFPVEPVNAQLCTSVKGD